MPFDPRETFAFEGGPNILDEGDLGIFNGMLTAGTPYRDAFCLAGLFAPPFVSSNFVIDVRLSGDRVTASSFRWHPSEVIRRGSASGLSVLTRTVLVPGARAGLVLADFERSGAARCDAELLVAVRGCLDQTTAWEFHRPKAETPLDATAVPQGLLLRNNAGGIAILSDLRGCAWSPVTRAGSGRIALSPGQRASVAIAFAVGPGDGCLEECLRLLADPRGAADRARAAEGAAIRDLFARLPMLEAEDPRLRSFYERSLLALLLHRWEVPEFLLRPYYGVGSINGGVVGCYLWDFAIGARMLCLYDPGALRAHILQFLRAGVDRGFGFNPMTGEPFGSWYAVNPEKLVRMAHEYVALTGDTSLLAERVNGKTVLDHVIECAWFGDDPGREPGLADYRGEGHHLELRRGFRYDNFVPDLNGRRCAAFRAAADLAAAAGRPAENLRDRARRLPRILRESLWDPGARWFRFIDASGRSDMRWTNEMFELIGTGALDAEEQEGLLSHLNEREFLSPFGMHSISKQDPAYDPEDIDHGGGGCFAGIAGEIVELLYGCGHAGAAEDLLLRILWWGERMPYWGDSMTGDRMDYRRDTPYQCALPGVAGAQAIIFGMCGVTAGLDGSVRVNPRPPAFSPRIALRGVRMRGLLFDLEVGPEEYKVRLDGDTLCAPIGEPRVLPRRS